MKEILIYLLAIATLIIGCDEGVTVPTTVTDIDENVYKIVTIGGQTWMAENLRTTHYADGTKIPYITDNHKWSTSVMPGSKAFCYFDNDFNNSKTNGALYTFGAALNGSSATAVNPIVQGACPTGWHIPTSIEWKQLKDTISALGYSRIEGNALKGITAWNEEGITDPFKFNAVPSGMLEAGYTNYQFFDSLSIWWSANKSSSYNAITYKVVNGHRGIIINNSYTPFGISVRCIKD